VALKPHDINLAHELDPAWIIALWLAIHGGDPSPIEQTVSEAAERAIAAQIIAELAPFVGGAAGHAIAEVLQPLHKGHAAKLAKGLTLHHLEAAMKALHVEVRVHEAQAGEARDLQAIYRQYCFRFQGRTICVPVGPQVAHPPVTHL
jgi:hypothetical protein